MHGKHIKQEIVFSITWKFKKIFLRRCSVVHFTPQSSNVYDVSMLQNKEPCSSVYQITRLDIRKTHTSFMFTRLPIPIGTEHF